MKNKKTKIKELFSEVSYVRDSSYVEEEIITVNFEDNTSIKYINNTIYDYKNLVNNTPLFNCYATLLIENKK